MSYQDPSDLARIPAVLGLAPTEGDAFMKFHEAAFRDGGAVPRKQRELIALAVATATRCSYCIDNHTRGALAAGATAEEIAETGLVAAAVCAGGTLAHSLLSHRIIEESRKESQEG